MRHSFLNEIEAGRSPFALPNASRFAHSEILISVKLGCVPVSKFSFEFHTSATGAAGTREAFSRKNQGSFSKLTCEATGLKLAT